MCATHICDLIFAQGIQLKTEACGTVSLMALHLLTWYVQNNLSLTDMLDEG